MKIYLVVASTFDKNERDQILGMLEMFEDDIPNTQISHTEEDYDPDDES